MRKKIFWILIAIVANLAALYGHVSLFRSSMPILAIASVLIHLGILILIFIPIDTLTSYDDEK